MLGLGELVEHLDLAVVVARDDHVPALKEAKRVTNTTSADDCLVL